MYENSGQSKVRQHNCSFNNRSSNMFMVYLVYMCVLHVLKNRFFRIKTVRSIKISNFRNKIGVGYEYIHGLVVHHLSNIYSDKYIM